LKSNLLLVDESMTLPADITKILRNTSRTFFIPIARLPSKLQETVACAYLCMRAIDEIEDHPDLDNPTKSALLRGLGPILQAHIGFGNPHSGFAELDILFSPYRSILPEVTLRIGEWLSRTPVEIAPRVWDATMAMAERMAYWVDKDWHIQTETDLDGYTFSVAGAVGLLICDVWGWFDGTSIDRTSAVHFGRGLQSVNILRNRADDAKRGVSFYPAGWSDKMMFEYARRNLDLAKAGVTSMPNSSFKFFVEIPLRLAEATLDAIETGVGKLTRDQVMKIVAQAG
jgi:farnesyl-diphosphate farnesyltransferase